MEAPDFWNDPVVSQEKMKELKSLKDDVQTYATLSGQYDDIETMIEMGYEEEEPELIPEIAEMMDEFISTYENIRMKTLYLVNMTEIMQFFLFMQERVEPSRVIGQRCFFVCIPAGRIRRGSSLRYSTRWMAMRQALSRSHSR